LFESGVESLPADFLRGAFTGIRIDVTKGHSSTLCRKESCTGLADAARRTGDNGALAFESGHAVFAG